MTDQELDTFAGKVVQKITEKKKDFWVEPEQHYKDHEWLGHLRQAVSAAVGTISKVLLVALAGGVIWLVSKGKGIGP